MRRGFRILIALIIGALVTFCTLEIITTNIYHESHSLINSAQSEPNVASVSAKYYTEPTTKNIEHKYASELSLANNITTQVISSQIPRWLERVRREEEEFTKSFSLIGVSVLNYKEKMYGYTDSASNTLYDLEPKIFQKSYFEPALLEVLVSLEVVDDVVRHYRMLRRITQTLWMTKFSADSKNPLNYCLLLCKQTHELFENDNVDSYMQIRDDLAHGELQQETMMLVDASYYLVFTLTNLCVNEYQSKLIKDPRLRNIAKQIDVSSNDIGQILENGRYKKGAERRLLPWETPYLRKKNKN